MASLTRAHISTAHAPRRLCNQPGQQSPRRNLPVPSIKPRLTDSRVPDRAPRYTPECSRPSRLSCTCAHTAVDINHQLVCTYCANIETPSPPDLRRCTFTVLALAIFLFCFRWGRRHTCRPTVWMSRLDVVRCCTNMAKGRVLSNASLATHARCCRRAGGTSKTCSPSSLCQISVFRVHSHFCTLNNLPYKYCDPGAPRYYSDRTSFTTNLEALARLPSKRAQTHNGSHPVPPKLCSRRPPSANTRLRLWALPLHLRLWIQGWRAVPPPSLLLRHSNLLLVSLPQGQDLLRQTETCAAVSIADTHTHTYP